MKCVECGALLPSDAKFCDKCGAEQEEVLFCNNCGAQLAADASFCHKCGQRYGAYYEYGNYDEDEYDDDDYEDEYEEEFNLDDEIRKIVDKYIASVHKTGYSYYNSAAVNNPKYTQILQNARIYVAPGVSQSEIYGFIDMSIFDNGKAGLVFTREALYEKSTGGKVVIPYNRVSEMEIAGGYLRFHGSAGYGKFLGIKSDVP